jgi:hypothetical protein
MFKFIKKLIVSFVCVLFLFSCEEDLPLAEPNEGEFGIITLTDSLIHLADNRFIEIKNNKEKNLYFIDSLKHTIEVEEKMIRNLNKNLHKKVEVTTNMEDNLILINKNLKKALANCKKKEKALIVLRKKSINDSIRHEKEINHLHESYSRKVRILRAEIDTNRVRMEELQGVVSDLLTSKKKKKRKK